MKLRNSITVGLLALAGLTASANAQATITASLSDLILGFRATGGTGSGFNLEVNLGSVSSFVTQTPGTTVVLSQLNVADLTATYGAGWNGRTDLLWSVVGAVGRGGNTGPNGQVASTLFGTSSTATQFASTAWTTKVSSLQNNGSVKIENLYTGAAGSLNGQTSTINSNYSFVNSTSTVGSWSSQEVPGTTGFAFFNPLSQLEGNTNISGSVYSDLYQLQPSTGAAVLLGSFALSSSGVLSFSTAASAIPEPSTYAAIFGAAAMGVALLRRRRMTAAATAKA